MAPPWVLCLFTLSPCGVAQRIFAPTSKTPLGINQTSPCLIEFAIPTLHSAAPDAFTLYCLPRGLYVSSHGQKRPRFANVAMKKPIFHMAMTTGTNDNRACFHRAGERAHSPLGTNTSIKVPLPKTMTPEFAGNLSIPTSH